MSESGWNHGVPHCRLCGKNHWAREGCFSSLTHKPDTPQAMKAKRGAPSSQSPLKPQPGAAARPATKFLVKRKSPPIRPKSALKHAGGSADAVIAARESLEPIRAQNGLTAARGGKNTKRKTKPRGKKKC